MRFGQPCRSHVQSERSCVATKDTYVIARATREMAATDTLVDIRALEADLSIQLADIGGLSGIDPQMIMGVLDVMQRFGLRPPPSMTTFARTMQRRDSSFDNI